MTNNDLEQLKAELWQRHREIFERALLLEGKRQVPDEPEIELGDTARAAQVTELFKRLDQQELNQIEEIDQALDRMAAGTYGICEDCGKAIPVERLRALPTTRYCMKCSLGQEEG